MSLVWHQLSCHSAPPAGEEGELRENKVRSMATQLLAKFEENSSTAKIRSKVRGGQVEDSPIPEGTVTPDSFSCPRGSTWIYFLHDSK